MAIHYWIVFDWVRLLNQVEHNLMNWVQLGSICLITLDWSKSHEVQCRCLIWFDCRTQSNSIHGSRLISEHSIDYAGKHKSFLSFCPRLGPGWKRWCLQGLMESTKKNGGSHSFFRDNWPWISTNILISAFFIKRSKYRLLHGKCVCSFRVGH